LSIRFDAILLDRVRRGAAARDTTPSGLVQRLVDEGLRAQEHPGIVFRDGPSGRRAALIAGPDVWEVVAALQLSAASADVAVTTTAGEMGLSIDQVKTAIDYYGSYSAEIEDLLLSAYSEGTVRAQLLLVSPQRFPRGSGDRTSGITRALAGWLSRPDVDNRPDEDWLA
jgi:hypothetical protein